MLLQTKTCGGAGKSKHGCGRDLPVADFYKSKTTKDGLSPYCSSCTRERNRKYLNANKDKARGYQVKKLYGLTLKEYEALVEKQDNKCAVCGVAGEDSAKGMLHVDHCHDSGEVRGLLCSKCNTALGLLDDDIDRMNALINYARRIDG